MWAWPQRAVTQMKWALKDEYEIVVAGDRAEALAQVKAAKPAVTLLDLGLPRRDGLLEIMRRKADPALGQQQTCLLAHRAVQPGIG